MAAYKHSHIRCFVTVAELGSVSAAAERLHRTPAAISMTLSNLEAQFGRALFESGGKSRLTPFGAYVFETARDQLKAMLKEDGPPPTGRWADLALLEPVRPYKSRHASTLLIFEAIEKAVAAHRGTDFAASALAAGA